MGRISNLPIASPAELTDDTVIVINTPGGKTKQTTWGAFKQFMPDYNTETFNSDDACSNRDFCVCDASGGAFTLTLPAVGTNFSVIIKKVDASANAITIQPAAIGLIDGQATINLSSQWDSVTLRCDGTN